MNTKTKFASALTALTVLATLALPSSEAEARGRGFAIGAGIVGAAIIGSAIAANSAPLYVDGGYRCRWVNQFDGWGNYMGKTKVCRHYY